MLANGTGCWEGRLAWVRGSAMGSAEAGKILARTRFADRLLTAGKFDGIDSQLAADGTSQLDWDIVGRERAMMRILISKLNS